MANPDETSGQARSPRWREDFPIKWLDDHYIVRREFAKVLTLGSGLLVGVNAIIAAVGKWIRRPGQMGTELKVANASQIPTGGSVQFRYPTDEDPCILVRTQSGSLRAYSQVCTHLSCAVVHKPEGDSLFCPCHRGSFSVNDGNPTGGPPTRRLPRIWIEQRGDELYAVGKDS